MDAYTINRLMQCGVAKRNIDELNISNINLSGQNLKAVDLKGFLVTMVNFENADLCGADLRGLEFAQSNCVCAKFMGADLRGASLAFGYFNNSDFSGADFRGALLAGALCSESIFCGADLRGARMGSEHYNSDFRGADLRGVITAPGCEFDKLNCDIRGALTTPDHLSRNSSNKRILPRIRPRQQMNVFDRTSNRHIGIVVDISIDGIKMAGKSAIPDGTMLSLVIINTDASGTAPQISFDARSVWSSQQQGTDWFNTGFKIEKISEAHRNMIQAILKDQEIIS